MVGSKLTMSAKGTPEADTLYKLWVCDRSTNTWIVLSDWSTKNKIDYTPSTLILATEDLPVSTFTSTAL